MLMSSASALVTGLCLTMHAVAATVEAAWLQPARALAYTYGNSVQVGGHQMYPLTNCPEDFSLGHRSTPGQKVPEYAGNTCEPW